jgi:hypothetical protein
MKAPFIIFLSLCCTAITGITVAAEPVTFNKHIAPIMHRHCVECHRPGEVGPFSLMDYADVAKRAEFIQDITHERRMPPYHADPEYGQFKNVRRLTDAELTTIKEWVKAGTPEGDAKDLPKPPQFTTGWKYGEPDLVLKMAEPFQIPAESRDIYQCFVIPTELLQDKYVSGIEFRPGNRKVVHHAIMYLDDSGQARKKDAADPAQGYRSFGGVGFIPTGGLGGWAPGVAPHQLPDGYAKFIKAKSDLALQVHYHPSGKPETDQSEVGIYFAKEKPKHLITGIALFNPAISIPANEAQHTINVDITLPTDVHVLGAWPHMHLLGRQMKVTAILPNQKEQPLLWVKDWDFNWQDGYEYQQPVALPKGTQIKLQATYDNTTNNPVNPNSPPKRVRFGEQTTDEMCLCTLIVYPDQPQDMRQLFTLPHARLGAALGGGSLPETMSLKQSGQIIRRFFELQK